MLGYRSDERYSPPHFRFKCVRFPIVIRAGKKQAVEIMAGEDVLSITLFHVAFDDPVPVLSPALLCAWGRAAMANRRMAKFVVEAMPGDRAQHDDGWHEQIEQAGFEYLQRSLTLLNLARRYRAYMELLEAMRNFTFYFRDHCLDEVLYDD